MAKEQLGDRLQVVWSQGRWIITTISATDEVVSGETWGIADEIAEEEVGGGDGVAIPIISNNSIHSLIFGGQIITG